jgi:O-antigen ligase
MAAQLEMVRSTGRRQVPFAAAIACILLAFLGEDSAVAWARPRLDLVVVGLIAWALRHRLGTARVAVVPVLLIAWCCASYTWSVDPRATERQIVYTVPLLVITLLVGSLLSMEELLDALRRAVVVALVISAAYVAVHRAGAWAPTLDGAPGFHGPFGHKNSAGFFFAIASALYVTELRTWRGRAVFVASVALVVLSRSSSALVLTALGIVAVPYLRHVARRGHPGRRATGSVTAVGALLAAPIVATHYLGNVTALVGRDATLTGRVDIWRAVIRVIRLHPWVGVGYGGPWLNVTDFSDRMFREIGFRAYHAHDAYLDWWLQLGVIGLVLVVGFVGLAMIRTGSAALEGSRAASSLFVILTMIVTAGIAESAPLTGEGMVFLGLISGAATAASRSTRPGAQGNRRTGVTAGPRSSVTLDTTSASRATREGAN